jgi:hypothetical protein
MKLYVNGDSHTAAAEAVNPHAFAEDDGRCFHLGRAPHPDNLAVSWGKMLAGTIKAAFYCDAESASSNARIIRTTQDWIDKFQPDPAETLILIQWSTWEREEWDIDGVMYQVNGSGIDQVPEDSINRYKEWVANIDWTKATQQAHYDIYQFHLSLTAQGYRHVFFNGNNHFATIPVASRVDWGNSYILPYDPTATYDSTLRKNGIYTVSPTSWHYGPDGHRLWANHMLQYIINNQLLV